MLSHTRNDMFTKECVLLSAVKIHPPILKRLHINRPGGSKSSPSSLILNLP